jgi:hypothetical protein
VEKVVGSVETPLKLAAAQSIENLIVQLTPTGTVSGRLMDQSGHVLGDVPIRLLGETRANEWTTRTNDRGEYRFFYLSPGAYRLTAGGPPSLSTRSGAATRFQEEFPLTYYPGFVDSARAESFIVKAGEERSGMNMVMTESLPPATRSTAVPAVSNGPGGNESAERPTQ